MRRRAGLLIAFYLPAHPPHPLSPNRPRGHALPAPALLSLYNDFDFNLALSFVVYGSRHYNHRFFFLFMAYIWLGCVYVASVYGALGRDR